MINNQTTQISSNLIRQRDDIILSLISKYLGYEMHRFNILDIKDRLSQNIDTHGNETFYIDGVRLVCFHPYSTEIMNDSLSYIVEAKIKYESYV